MEYRKLGDSNLEVSAITFGSWAAGGWMWGGTERNESVKAIKASYNEGVTSIDTAPIYGQGLSEEIVGEAIKGIPRDKVQILTKYGMRWDLKKGDFAFKSKNNDGQDIDVYKYSGKESIIKECENSLKRLGTDYIDLYQIHWPDVTTPIEETMEAIQDLITQGKVLYAGVCNYNENQMMEAAKTINLVSNQVPYSMVNRGIEQVVLPYSLANKKSIIAYSPLERGLLTGKINPGHVFANGDHRATNHFFTETNIIKVNAFLQEIIPLAADKGISVGQLVLRWTIDIPGITIALAGARNAEQAIQNAKAIHVKISPDQMSFINSQLDQLLID
ncbi:aldo/keto reductase [Arcticibacter svalbardensis MN12-7]|uniref:Aldo/keto reductase n=1 Tax=Arcticibacter svalbardensis MN12-7 TaxID=1150600 RepID=R9GLZ7_9SPHI|nr:aldo/keto reductase [Arcticibacter svalbardensis]EOR92706.1 aldo/keto reductase [Arcticibacter svalbardensis MN12-7]